MGKRVCGFRRLSALSLILLLGGCLGRSHEEWAAVREGSPIPPGATALKAPLDAAAGNKETTAQWAGDRSGDAGTVTPVSQPDANGGPEGQKNDDAARPRMIPPPPTAPAKEHFWHLWPARAPAVAKGSEIPPTPGNAPPAKPADQAGGKVGGTADGPAVNRNGPAPARSGPPSGPDGVRTVSATGADLAPAPGNGVVPAGVAPDPHQRAGPTATGALLNLPPGESLAERAVALNGRLAAIEAERRALELKAQQLEMGLAAREQSLQMSSKEMLDAAEEIARTRRELQNWSQELAELRARLRKRDKEDLEAMKSLIPLLERLLESAPPEPKRDPEGTPPKR
jgi:hypothetical protein